MTEHHAPLAPSSAPQWGRCSGSVAANLQAPDIANARAREGTASHWVGSECLKAWYERYPEVNPDCTPWVGQAAPNGVVIDTEMVEGAQAWVDDVVSVSKAHGAPHNLFIEARVDMPEIHAENWGTLDSAIWLPEKNTLYLWDYKYGHREVTVEGNLQLIDYACGLISRCSHMQRDTKIVMRIVQPFAYHAVGPIREWITDVEDLGPYFDLLKRQANSAMTAPTLTAGKHCRDCHAISRCATAKRAAYSVLTYAGEPYEINTLDGSELATERRILQEGAIIIKARIDALEDELRNQISRGDKSSGLTLQNKEGRLKWNISIPQVIALGAQFGADISKPEALTPTQALKKIPALETMLDQIAVRPSTGLKLISAKDSRTAYAFKSRSK